MSGRCGHLGEKGPGGHSFGKVHPVSVLYPGV